MSYGLFKAWWLVCSVIGLFIYSVTPLYKYVYPKRIPAQIIFILFALAIRLFVYFLYQIHFKKCFIFIKTKLSVSLKKMKSIAFHKYNIKHICTKNRLARKTKQNKKSSCQ